MFWQIRSCGSIKQVKANKGNSDVTELRFSLFFKVVVAGCCYLGLTSNHSLLFGCYGYLILQSFMSIKQIDTLKWLTQTKTDLKKSVTELPHYLPKLEIQCTQSKFWEVVWNERKLFFRCMTGSFTFLDEVKFWIYDMTRTKKSKKTPVTELRD